VGKFCPTWQLQVNGPTSQQHNIMVPKKYEVKPLQLISYNNKTSLEIIGKKFGGGDRKR
jgi:hypothetical protein